MRCPVLDLLERHLVAEHPVSYEFRRPRVRQLPLRPADFAPPPVLLPRPRRPSSRPRPNCGPAPWISQTCSCRCRGDFRQARAASVHQHRKSSFQHAEENDIFRKYKSGESRDRRIRIGRIAFRSKEDQRLEPRQRNRELPELRCGWARQVQWLFIGYFHVSSEGMRMALQPQERRHLQVYQKDV